ncbi:MAG TPA: putative PEP-binding protein, partial [Thermoanaerobaculia bacterium]|nr:putative PEP-binding protein [Thermoanaerobaculia bacterium]
PQYIESKILPVDPFESIDEEGVGQLVSLACERGRKTRGDLHLGICGEHGGDPRSIDFFERAGLDYVSCSPYRVPIARLAAAQASLKQKARAEAEAPKVRPAQMSTGSQVLAASSMAASGR